MGRIKWRGFISGFRSLVFYLILMTMLMNLLPDKKYENYLRLFTGVVFLLLFFQPFTGLLGARERIAGLFERLTFQNEVQLLRKELQSVDGERIGRMMDGYQSAVENDLRVMADTGTLECRTAEAVFDREEDSESFGSIKAVRMTVGLASDTSGISREALQERRYLANREIEGLRERIGEYYGLEERQIEINLEAE